jgi:hypothetical protein
MTFRHSIIPSGYNAGVLEREIHVLKEKAVRMSLVTTICSVSYWRFISGFGPIGSNLGRRKQIGQYMQIVQSRINTGYVASC